MSEKIGIDIETGILLYLDHVIRCLKKNQDFEPHPLVKALALALEASKDKTDGNYAGVSGDPTKELREMYSAVIEKKGDKFVILAFHDLSNGLELPLDLVVQLLHISIKLDKFENNTVPLNDAVDILNEVISSLTFKLLAEDEIEPAIKNMVQKIKQGNVIIPPKLQKLIQSLKNLKTDTKWEEFDPVLREFVGGLWAAEKYDNKTVMITSKPKTVEKNFVINAAKSQLFMRHLTRKTCDEKQE